MKIPGTERVQIYLNRIFWHWLTSFAENGYTSYFRIWPIEQQIGNCGCGSCTEIVDKLFHTHGCLMATDNSKIDNIIKIPWVSNVQIKRIQTIWRQTFTLCEYFSYELPCFIMYTFNNIISSESHDIYHQDTTQFIDYTTLKTFGAKVWIDSEHFHCSLGNTMCTNIATMTTLSRHSTPCSQHCSSVSTR